MINNIQFYYKYGIRLHSNLINPNFHKLEELKLPMDSVVHFCDYDGINLGPNNSDVLFNGTTKPIQVKHVMELKSDVGFPRKLSYIANEDIRFYHNQNKRTRWLKNIESSLRDPQTLIVNNYSFLLRNYKYVKSFYSEYYKWLNIFNTIIDEIIQFPDTAIKNHYLQLNIPKVIPGITKLDNACKREINQEILKTFRDTNSYVLLEIWKWLNDDKDISSTSVFSKIPLEKLNKINFIFVESDNWCVLNLAYLFAFSKQSKNIEEFKRLSRLKLSSEQLRKRYLRMMVTIMEIKTLNLAKINNVDVDEVNTSDIEEQNILAEKVLTDDKLQDEIDKNSEILTIDNVTDLDISGDDEDEDGDKVFNEILKIEDQKLDTDLAYLNDISNLQIDDNKPTKTLSQFLNDQTPPSYEDGIMNIANKLADENLISAPEYKRCGQLSIAYKSLTMPDGTLMHEFANIKPEDLTISEEPNISDKITVLDKTMLKSSLLEFDKKYIENILKKDIINSVLSVHNAGVAVTDYKIEPVVDILNEYEMHIVKLQPLSGKQSTIRFKVPIIRPDGTFIANGTKYRFRKLRGD